MINVLGDEQMISDYKSVYTSPVIYATSALHLALACLPIISLFIVAIKKNTRLYRLLAFASIAATATIGKLLN